MQTPDEIVTALRTGQGLPARLDVLLEQGRVSVAASRAFEHALKAGSAEEREVLVRALVKLGRRVDPLAQPGIRLLRDPAVIATLAGPGLRAGGAARDEAIDALTAGVPALLLQAHGQALAEDLLRQPDASILRLVAKSRAEQARPALRRVLGDPSLAGLRDAQIAAAAFGDARAENEFIRAFERAGEATEKAELAMDLAIIGTPATLRALGEAMRSDLVFEMPRVFRRSVRVDIVAALSLANPELPFLWDNAVRDDEGYARIEAFCEAHYGVRWTKPRPPFLWIEGQPADHGY